MIFTVPSKTRPKRGCDEASRRSGVAIISLNYSKPKWKGGARDRDSVVQYSNVRSQECFQRRRPKASSVRVFVVKCHRQTIKRRGSCR